MMSVDVRGVWPVLVGNGWAVELHGEPRSITVTQAIKHLEGKALWADVSSDSPETWNQDTVAALAKTYSELAQYWMVGRSVMASQTVEYISNQAAHCARRAAYFAQYL